MILTFENTLYALLFYSILSLQIPDIIIWGLEAINMPQLNMNDLKEVQPRLSNSSINWHLFTQISNSINIHNLYCSLAILASVHGMRTLFYGQ